MSLAEGVAMAKGPWSLPKAAGVAAVAVLLLVLLSSVSSADTLARQAPIGLSERIVAGGGGGGGDTDEDGIDDSVDNCPTVFNPGQEDSNGDGVGDACDDDGDGIANDNDDCDSSPEDFDDVADQDGCPEEDPDLDSVSDANDGCPVDPEDVDGVFDADGCPEPANLDQTGGMVCAASSALNTNEPLAQSFVPAKGSLLAVDVLLTRGPASGVGNMTMRIREGSIGGAVVASAERVVEAYGNLERRVERFGMAPVIAMTPGNTYVIELDSNSDAHGWCRATTDTYAAGCAISAGSAQCGYDMSFQTTEPVPLAVTRTDDPAPDGCAPGDCSVREAVMASVRQADAQVINIPAGVYTLTIAGAGEEGGATGDLDLYDIAPSVTINGLGSTYADTIIEGCSGDPCTPVDRVFDIEGTGLVVINKLTIRNGNPGGGLSGGGIAVESGFQTPQLILNDSEVSGNTANFGGGISNQKFVVTLNNTRVVGNSAPSGLDAGGIYNGTNGVMSINDSIISNNTARQGGGIRNDGTLVVNRTSVVGNTATSAGGGPALGGGIANLIGTTTLNESSVNNNDSEEDGGGIANRSGGTVNINNSTVSGNSANYAAFPNAADGGGIYNDFDCCGGTSTVNLNNATVAFNSSTGSGGGISTFTCCGITTGFLTNVKNSIVADNAAPTGPDCSGTQTSQGYNLFGSTAGCTIAGNTTGNLTNLDARLVPLSPNGGPTETHALCEGVGDPYAPCAGASPAIDAANPTGCTSHAGSALTTDQRGVGYPRSTDGDGDLTPRCDMGAYEAPQAPDTDGDGLPDPADVCPAGDTGWTSDGTTDHDSDGCRDAGEDTDDDNDGIGDGADACATGDLGWSSAPSTDHDGDGCRDAGEDTDDDNDGVLDGADACPLGAGAGTDTDGDGCKDDGEDFDDDNDTYADEAEGDAGSDPLDAASTPEVCDGADNDLNEGVDEGFLNTDGDAQANCIDPDDDNDGVVDGADACAAGDLSWTSNVATDHDGDGCRDAGEDTDDDNDGVVDGGDACPLGGAAGADTDGDGCKDAVEDIDDDNDGIEDAVDEQPLVVSDRFSDKPAGKTSGRLTFVPSTLTVKVQDAPSPKGVRFIVTGTGKATARLDGKKPTWSLPAGRHVLTDPDAETTTEVEADGPAELELVVESTTHTVVVEAGEEAKVSEGVNTGDQLAGFTLQALVGDITLNGNPVPEGTSEVVGEICDGLDNDGNDGTDEGYLGTDADNGADCVDLDDDNDGYKDTVEAHVGTSPLYPCEADWPSNLYEANPPDPIFPPNTVDILDITSFLGPVRRLDTPVTAYADNRRWDLVPGPDVFPPNDINILDLTALFTGEGGFPPMFGGGPAFGHTCPLP
jgi:hypothetical protein